MRRPVLAALGVALLLRVAVVLLQPDVTLIGDAGDYDRHGRSLAAGDGYPDTAIAAPGSPSALRPPLYPAWLGAVYAVSGDSVLVARLAGAVLGTLTVYLLWSAVRDVWGPRVALVCAGLAAVAPPLVFVNGSLASEQLFLPLVAGLLVVLLRAREPGASLWWAAAAGALVGLCALTRVVGLTLMLALVVALWPRGWRAPVAAVLAALCVVTPWTVRNTLVFDRFVPLATQEGFNLYGTYNELSRRSTDPPAPWTFPLKHPDVADRFGRPGWDEARISEELGAEARRFAVEHPEYVLRVAGWNSLRLVRAADQPLDDIEQDQLGIPDRARRVVDVSVVLMWLGAAVGAVLMATGRRRRGPVFLWLVPVSLAVPVLLFLATMRYRLPLDLFLLTLCAVAVAGRPTRPRSPADREQVDRLSPRPPRATPPRRSAL